MDASSSHHRKIELQSNEDFVYLIKNARCAALEHISKAFPPIERDASGDTYDMRAEVEQLVNEFINRTYTLAAPNLTINGLPIDDLSIFYITGGPPTADTSKTTLITTASTKLGRKGKKTKKEGQPPLPTNQFTEAYEPFDGRKRARVVELASEEEEILREIAILKRRVPASTAANWNKTFSDWIEEDEHALERAVAAAVSADKGKGNEHDIKNEKKAGIPRILFADGGEKGWEETVGSPLERQSEVEDAFERAVGGLHRLKKEMPSTVAKMERARNAGEYILVAR